MKIGQGNFTEQSPEELLQEASERNKRRGKKRNKRLSGAVKHVIGRMQTRYGLVITREDYDKMRQMVEDKQTQFIMTDANDSDVHFIHFNGKKIRAVINRETGVIITVLPSNDDDEPSSKKHKAPKRRGKKAWTDQVAELTGE